MRSRVVVPCVAVAIIAVGCWYEVGDLAVPDGGPNDAGADVPFSDACPCAQGLAGFSGPVAVLFDAGSPAQCPKDSVPLAIGYSTPGALPTVCGGCQVQIGGGSCSSADNFVLDTYAATSCGGANLPVDLPETGACVQLANNVASIKTTETPDPTGTCTYFDSDSGLDPFTPMPTALGCASTLGLCSGGACTITPPAGAKLCVYRNGGGSCQAPFTDQHTVFGITNDTRACAPCSKSPTSYCGASISLFSTIDCSGTAYPVNSDVTANDKCVSSPFRSAKVVGPGLLCDEPNPASGSATLGQSTICCEP